MNLITIERHRSSEPELVVNRETAFDVGIERKKRAYISFGNQKYCVDVAVLDTVSRGKLFIPAYIIDKMHVPDYVVYEVRAYGNEIRLGPFIGILGSVRYENITKDRLEHEKECIRDYSKLHGAITVFSLDSVNKDKRLIKGFCFNPEDNSWKEGIFPYPCAIYRTIGLNEDWQNHFLSTIGDTVFNGQYFSKWEMYKWFSTDASIKDSLPETRLYRSEKDIFDMLKRQKCVYIKPDWGMKGHGVVKASITDEGILFEYRKDKKNNRIVAENRIKAIRIMKDLFAYNECIIQKGIDLIKCDEGVVDFRAVMQKDGTANWVCTVIVARAGAKRSVVSNISSGGKGFMPEELLKDVMGMNNRRALQKIIEMRKFCLKVCRTLDGFGVNCGILGIDIGIDYTGKIWLIEINHRSPHPAIALCIQDRTSYNKIISGPLLYAKSLAGFGRNVR